MGIYPYLSSMDTIDRMAWKLEEKIEMNLAAAEGDPNYAWLTGKLMMLNAKLEHHHWKYRQAMFNGRETQGAKHANAIMAIESAYESVMRPPGSLNIDVNVGF